MVDYNGPILNKDFERLVKNNQDDYYCVLAQVYYDDSTPDHELSSDEIKSRFKENKDKLEKFVEENNIHVYNKLEFLPQMGLKMIGKQILELSKKDYIEYITQGDKTIVTAD